jgi:hypothetical protein
MSTITIMGSIKTQNLYVWKIKGEPNAPYHVSLGFCMQKLCGFKVLLVNYPKPLGKSDIKVVDTSCGICFPQKFMGYCYGDALCVSLHVGWYR